MCDRRVESDSSPVLSSTYIRLLLLGHHLRQRILEKVSWPFSIERDPLVFSLKGGVIIWQHAQRNDVLRNYINKIDLLVSKTPVLVRVVVLQCEQFPLLAIQVRKLTFRVSLQKGKGPSRTTWWAPLVMQIAPFQVPNVQVQPLSLSIIKQNVERILTLGRTILPSSPTSVTVNSFLSRNLKGSTHDRPCTSSRSTTECLCPHNTWSKFLYHTTPKEKECTSYIMQQKASKHKHCF